MSDLSALRKQIDSCDEQIMELLVKRFGLVDEVKRIKTELGAKPLDEKRWNDVQERIAGLAKENSLDPDGIVEIYDQIHHYALKYIYED